MSKKITDLTLLSAADASDLVALVDVSASTTKKTTVQGLVPGMSVYPSNLAAGVSSSSWAWQTWSPSFTNFTLGNGTASAAYLRIGNAVFCRLSITLGSTSSMGTAPLVSLPFAAVSYPNISDDIDAIGVAGILDAGTAAFPGRVFMASTTQARFDVESAGGTYVANAAIQSGVPMTWTTGDKLTGTWMYEAA